jgi:hypothetical protein
VNPLATVLDELAPVIGDALVDKARSEIEKIAGDASDPVQALVLGLLAEAVGEMGTDGIEIAQAEIRRLLEGENVTLDWASPRTASDAVALLQNAERARRKKVDASLEKFGKIMGVVGATLVKAAVSGAIGGR